MKLRLRTLISGSKTIEHAKYNLSFQLTADAIGYLQPKAVPDGTAASGRQMVTAEAYILNGADRARITDLLTEMVEIFPGFVNSIAEIKHVIGITDLDPDTQESLGLDDSNLSSPA